MPNSQTILQLVKIKRKNRNKKANKKKKASDTYGSKTLKDKNSQTDAYHREKIDQVITMFAIKIIL